MPRFRPPVLCKRCEKFRVIGGSPVCVFCRPLVEAELKRKDTTRARTRLLVLSGRLTPTPCRCGATDVQAHHTDYDDPRAVVWLCDPCHRAEHGRGRKAA